MHHFICHSRHAASAWQIACPVNCFMLSFRGLQHVRNKDSLQGSNPGLPPPRLDVSLAECLQHLAVGGWRNIIPALEESVVAVTAMPCSQDKLISMTNAFWGLGRLQGESGADSTLTLAIYQTCLGCNDSESQSSCNKSSSKGPQHSELLVVGICKAGLPLACHLKKLKYPVGQIRPAKRQDGLHTNNSA